jgi:putative spermidine/putrescine transport system ATP-binding protein
MGVVFQNYALFPHMNVAENIAFPLRARSASAADIKVRLEHVLRLVRLSGMETRRPSELSGGQQQRVALARALVFSPDVILMDEPLGALDRQLRERLQIEIKHIQRELNLTVVYVTHDQAEALTMSDRVAVFNNGEVQQIASGRELYDEPCNAFVAQFVGESNRLSGVVSEIGGDRCAVRTDGGRIIHARLVGDATLGSRAVVCFRPERVALGPHQDDRQNVFEVQVEEFVYHGDHSRLSMRLGSDGLLFTRLPNALGNPGAAAGDMITLGWRADDCRAFAGSSSHSSFPDARRLGTDL